MASEISKYQPNKAKVQPTSFFMSSYIMDTICFMAPFLLMGWNWTLDSAEPIHIYHSKLWEDKEKNLFYEIYNWVAVSMHIVIFSRPPHRISDAVLANPDKVAN
jgi:hypothetical protein